MSFELFRANVLKGKPSRKKNNKINKHGEGDTELRLPRLSYANFARFCEGKELIFILFLLLKIFGQLI